MTHSHIWHSWHNRFKYVTGLIHMCDTAHSYAWPDSCTCVTWLTHVTNTEKGFGKSVLRMKRRHFIYSWSKYDRSILAPALALSRMLVSHERARILARALVSSEFSHVSARIHRHGTRFPTVINTSSALPPPAVRMRQHYSALHSRHPPALFSRVQHTALQHTATHCNTL